MDELDEIINALDLYCDAKNRHDDALREYDGYSWDWAGESFIEDLNNARDRFREALNKYVDRKIDEKQKKLKDEIEIRNFW